MDIRCISVGPGPLDSPGRFDLTRPCKDCPYRNDIEPWVQASTREEQIASMRNPKETPVCHYRRESACPGAHALRLRENCLPPDLTRLAFLKPAVSTWLETIDSLTCVFPSFSALRAAITEKKP